MITRCLPGRLGKNQNKKLWWSLRLQCCCEDVDKVWFYNAKKDGKIGGHRKIKQPKETTVHIRLRLVRTLTISCGALRVNQQSASRGPRRDILSVLIRTSGLVDVHSVLVLPSRTRCGTLACVLLLPQTLCDLLEHHVQSFLVLSVLPRFDGVVFCERYELRV
jgi:hypothetical protein